MAPCVSLLCRDSSWRSATPPPCSAALLRRADPAVLAQDGVRQGIAYVDESHDEDFLHCCTTGLSKALSFVPCCWPALPFGCVPVNENEEQVLMVFGKFYDTLRELRLCDSALPGRFELWEDSS